MIFNDIYQKIKSNYYSVGDLLPTEHEMQEIYGVSRAPIRVALGRLQNEGFIQRKPGKGTVVAENSVSAPWTPMGGFSSHFKTKASVLECNTIDVSKAIVEEHITNKLKLEPETPVIKVTRLRKENNNPIFLLNHYYVDVEMEKIKQAGDILYMRQFASQVLGINFEYVNEELVAINADKYLANLLEVELGEALLKVSRISYDKDFKPVEYVEYYVKAKDWPYKVMFSREGQNFEY
ncbi:GntR family transcriptional regulator [Salinibacillus xinjiangensis]|uniref:UTRA domain-containing protein n=1 Tax=Salinibacillus xinjiangensis TaxID=1229268 RepID=A0A6G1X8N4_9BACI|nr:GntR family transcriptional regulator [Salinibacillus xinjiangensis]MRG87266.1 UTRA domain-containing protein [Salinibacillus xinjiangensis]